MASCNKKEIIHIHITYLCPIKMIALGRKHESETNFCRTSFSVWLKLELVWLAMTGGPCTTSRIEVGVTHLLMRHWLRRNTSTGFTSRLTNEIPCHWHFGAMWYDSSTYVYSVLLLALDRIGLSQRHSRILSTKMVGIPPKCFSSIIGG